MLCCISTSKNRLSGLSSDFVCSNNLCVLQGRGNVLESGGTSKKGHCFILYRHPNLDTFTIQMGHFRDKKGPFSMKWGTFTIR